jgi:catechol 2,3-dioxygenase-like lactoylglutathione lyase family enzyme
MGGIIMLGSADVGATLPVKDVGEAKKFYEETLGLTLVSEDPGGILYSSGNSKLFVYPSEFAGTNKATAAAWNVDDVEGVVNELKDKGVAFEQYDNLPGATREGDIHLMGDLKAAWFKDPSGNILNVVNM